MAGALQRLTLRQLHWPVRARHVELSIIASPDDDPGQPSPELLRLAVAVIQGALEIDLSDLEKRSPGAGRFINRYPGEHYRLLASAVRQLRAKTVVIDRAAEVMKALRVFKASSADFADCLIERTAASAGCGRTMTFDVGAAKTAGMTLIQ